MRYYRDIKVKYFICGVIGALLILCLTQRLGVFRWILALAYIIACVIFFEHQAMVRIGKLLDIINVECRLRDFITVYLTLREKCVTSLSKAAMDLTLSTAYLHLGDAKEALTYLKRYHEGEKKGKYEYIVNKKEYRKRCILLDAIYHNNMAAVYAMLGDASEVEKQQTELKSDLERLSLASADAASKAILERIIEVRRIETAIGQEDLDDYENMELYLKQLLDDETTKTLARVRYQYLLYRLYTALGKPEQAEASREFVLKNGGDSYYVDKVKAVLS